MNILKKIYSFYKHAVDLYNTKSVTRKEYLIVLLLFALVNLLSYAVLVNGFILILLFFAPLLLIATFNRLKNTIISSIPAFILSFLIPYLILVLNVSTDYLKINIPIEKYYSNIFLVYFPLLFLTGLILPVSKKEITYEKEDEYNKKLNLLHIFNKLITLNLKASINRAEYIISCILAFILPISMLVLSYLLVILLRIFYRSNLNAVNILAGDGPFVLDLFGPEFLIYVSFAVCIAVTIILFFLLFILRLNYITKNLIIKFSIITTYIILLAVGITILLEKDNLSGIIMYAFSLFMIPAFIKGNSVNKNINILKPIYNFYKHIVDLYDTKPVTRKEYFTFLGVFLFLFLFILFLVVLLYTLNPIILIFIVLPAPSLLIATFNRLKNTIISSIPAFILSFLIPYLILVLYVSTSGLEMIIPLDSYFRNTALVYFALLFLSGLILPVYKKEITYEKVDEDNKKLNLIKIFNELITLNFKASINKVQYIISFIAAFTAPAFMVYLSYLLIKLLRPIYRHQLEAENVYKFNFFSPEMVISITSIEIILPITILLIFLLFILRLNDITKNFYVKLSIITLYIILITAEIVTAMQIHIVLIPVFTILLFMIPAFINGKSVKENTI